MATSCWNARGVVHESQLGGKRARSPLQRGSAHRRLPCTELALECFPPAAALTSKRGPAPVDESLRGKSLASLDRPTQKKKGAAATQQTRNLTKVYWGRVAFTSQYHLTDSDSLPPFSP